MSHSKVTSTSWVVSASSCMGGRRIHPCHHSPGCLILQVLSTPEHAEQTTLSLARRALIYQGESESRSVMSDSLRPHGLHSPWNSAGQDTGVGGLSLLQGIFPTQGLNPGLPHCRITLSLAQWALIYQGDILLTGGQVPAATTGFNATHGKDCKTLAQTTIAALE